MIITVVCLPYSPSCLAIYLPISVGKHQHFKPLSPSEGKYTHQPFFFFSGPCLLLFIALSLPLSLGLAQIHLGNNLLSLANHSKYWISTPRINSSLQWGPGFAQLGNANLSSFCFLLWIWRLAFWVGHSWWFPSPYPVYLFHFFPS